MNVYGILAYVYFCILLFKKTGVIPDFTLIKHSSGPLSAPEPQTAFV